MALRNEGPRERILLMGGWGVGKSTAAVDIKKMMEQTGAEGTMYVLDTTYEGDRNFEGVDVQLATVEAWDEYLGRVRDFTAKSTKNDWLVIDRIDPVWDQAQNGFIERVFGTSADEWFLDYRKDKQGHPLAGEYGMNWSVIKKMYGSFMTEVMRFKGNVLVTAKAENIQQPNREGTGGDSAEVRAEFGKYGVKPGGEKNLGFLFHTVLLLAEPKQGQWTYTTIRDRNRQQVKNKEMKGFVVSYLIPVAKWKL